MIKYIFFFCTHLFYFSMALGNTQLECFNPRILESTLSVEKLEGTWILSSQSGRCETQIVDLDINSKNYENWLGLQSVDSKICLNIGRALFGQDRKLFGVEISPSVQEGKQGFLKLKFENLSEYGPESIKTFLKCHPA